ncbi:hypothetical protein DFQ27_004333 [Actinomortierella ambigua]|uniref:Transmembrane protein n=1 Tax=Actinomortierella ambigua TaxID=1343610 RepID=A0A9P6Q3G2_9FUNG|nr:hypothetical protein DFQ27_004333 [Actinomortierella ambigua]
MDVEVGIVECDWRVDTSDCSRPHEFMLMQVVLGVCVVFYLILAAIAYGILWARKHYRLTPPGPVIDFKQPDGSIRPKPIEAFCVFSIAGLLIRSVSIILVIVDAFPDSTIVKELLSEISVCCAFPSWASLVIGIWYATPNLSAPGDNLRVRVPRPKVVNMIFFYLLFGPFLLDLPSVISSGIFLMKHEYVEANTAIAVHFITLGTVLLVATGLFYFTLNQLAEAIAEYSMPSDLINIHIGVTPTALDGSGGEIFVLSPLPESEREHSVWGTDLSKVRVRLINIRNVGTIVLFFYVAIYLAYGIARPMIHSHIVWNVFFCVCFNLDPGTPTIFVFFILSILHHRRAEAPKLRQVYSSGNTPVSSPMVAFTPTFRPTRPFAGLLRDELPSHYFSDGTSKSSTSNDSSRPESVTPPASPTGTNKGGGGGGGYGSKHRRSPLSPLPTAHLHFVTPRLNSFTDNKLFSLEDLDDVDTAVDSSTVQQDSTTSFDIESLLVKPPKTFEIPYPSPPCSSAKSDGSSSTRSHSSPPSQHSGV